MSTAGRIYVGTAGWSIPKAESVTFDGGGTHLERYARRLSCVEINSSFYRPHLEATYERWAMSTPADFRFAVKVPRVVTHELKLQRCRQPVARFLAETAGLGCKRGPLLVQLPPSAQFEARLAASFFAMLRSEYPGPLVCEPRHPSWFAPQVTDLLIRHGVSRVAADPPPVGEASLPDGWDGLAYFRLHGSPRMYWSPYDAIELATLARVAETYTSDVWVVFDNTATGSALRNARALGEVLTGANLAEAAGVASAFVVHRGVGDGPEKDHAREKRDDEGG